MTTSTEMLNDAIGALQGAADAYNGKKAEIDAALAASQAGYAALSADLKGVVNSQMQFTGTIDPDIGAPTNVDGGTFNTIKAAIDAAPYGATCLFYLVAGKSFPITADITLGGREVSLRKTGAGDNPVIAPVAYEVGALNSIRGFASGDFAARLFIEGCDIDLPTAKVNAGNPWSSSASLVVPYAPQEHRLALRNCVVTGAENLGLISANAGGVASLRMQGTTLDGAIFGVIVCSGGVVSISQSSTTLLNGAALNDGGVLGTNLLKN